VTLFSRELSPIYHSVAWAEAYIHTKWHLDPSRRLPTTDMGRKLGGCAPLVELGPHLIQCGQGRGLYLHAKFHVDAMHPTVWPQYTSVTDRTNSPKTTWRNGNKTKTK